MAAETYLLKGSPEDMKRWRLAATGRGQSFAAFCRDALDALTDGPAEDAVPSGRASFGPRKATKEAPVVGQGGYHKRERVSICEHRRPAGQWCRYCDA